MLQMFNSFHERWLAHLWGSQTLPMIDGWVKQWPDNGFCHFWHFDVCRDFSDAMDKAVADADYDDNDDNDDVDNKDDIDW